MVSAVESLCESASFQPGDRVQTLRGSTSGTIVRILEDGRIAWRPDGSGLDLIDPPEGLRKLPQQPC
jgi:transcription elongation factor